MNKLLNQTLRRFITYAGLVLVCSIPAYYFIISWLWQYEMNEHQVVLTDEAARHDSYMIIMSVTLLTTFFFILLLVGFILLNRRISKHLWQPFYQSLGKIRNFSLAKQHDVVFEQTNIAEFAELNQSLQKLISGNISAYNQQKEFADNASHELQTPLAVVQSKLDMLLQSQSLTDEQYSLIEDASKAVARVGRINKNLLLLTKIENSQYMEMEQVDISQSVKNTLSFFSNYDEDKFVNLQTDILPRVYAEGNRMLVELVLNNLLANAIRYSPSHATIIVQLSNNMLILTNPGLQALQQEHLFKRFGMASSLTPGTGLGLPLVKQVCDRYGWKIDYTFSSGAHTFSLRF